VSVGIVGLGGLGVMGIKLAKALGASVTAISRGGSKRTFALGELGCDAYVAMDSADDVKAHAKTLDLILSTVSDIHDATSYLGLLANSGSLVNLGLVTEPHSVKQLPLIFQRLSFAGSVIGGIANTQEVVDLCAAKGIYPVVEVVPVWDINRVYEMLDCGNDSGVRFVLDLQGTLNPRAFDKCTAPPPEFVSVGAVANGRSPKKASSPAKAALLRQSTQTLAKTRNEKPPSSELKSYPVLAAAAAVGALVALAATKLKS